MIKKMLNDICIIFLWGFVGFGLIGCGDSRSASPVSPVQEMSAGQEKTETGEQLSEDTEGSAIDTPVASEGTIVIVAVGDSITYGQGSSSGGYPAILQRKLTTAGYNVVVKNQGIPGEHSYSTYQRWLGEIAHADISLLMIGTNDIINPADCHERFNCRTLEYIEAMINQALISKRIPLVSSVTPAKTDGNRDRFNPEIRELNAEIRALAENYGVALVDNYQAVKDNGGDSLYSDDLHFDDVGYTVIAQQWYDAIVDGQLIEAVQ